MPVLTNARQEGFAQSWAKTKSASEACREHSIDPRNSTRWTKNNEIRRRVDELLGRGAERATVTIESLIQEAAIIQAAAEKAGQHAAATAALTVKAKLSGLWVERVVSENTNVNYAVGDSPATAEEWEDEHTGTPH